MPTKVSRTCDALIEISWLAALILVPVFFNVLSARTFEPDKITLLRSLVLFMIAAFGVKLLEEWRGGRRLESSDHPRPVWWQTPLVLPALALALVYIISTIFSITPWVSLLGSYQRLQGTYTTFSYMVIFALIMATLRRRDQVDRLVTVAILATVPVALYAILQHYSLDPLPWGGDTKIRVAANMGNSIFVAAYLIMVVPLVVYRLIDTFSSILKDQDLHLADVIRAAAYTFILVVQLVAIYWTQSRGPQLGLLAGLFFLFVLLSVYWRQRWLTFATIGLGGALAVFLVILNIAPGPLEKPICEHPYIGRICTVMELETGTGKVRDLIWQGAVQLVEPHAPLTYPDGTTDRWNFLRPLIGYGPESMYVAYNPFYPPDLAHYESRNASPDRSHNETFDALVITGVLGLAVQLFLYGSVFYYALKWLGLIRSRRQALAFVAALVLGGAIGGFGIAVAGSELFGVGLPFGITIGLLAYIAVRALLAGGQEEEREHTPYALLLIALVSAVVAHFVEIHFGIAIAATRTYFWAYAGLMVVTGYVLVQQAFQVQEPQLVPVEVPTREVSSRKRREQQTGRRRSTGSGRLETTRTVSPRNRWLGPILVMAFLMAITLATLGFEFIANPGQNRDATPSAWQQLQQALTTLPQSNNAGTPFTLGLMALTWLIGGIVVTAEMDKQGTLQEARTGWSAPLLTYLGVSMLISVIYWLILAGQMSFLTATSSSLTIYQIADSLAGLLDQFYEYVFLLIVLGAVAALIAQRLPHRFMQTFSSGARSSGKGDLGTVGPSIIVAPALLILAAVLISTSNLDVVQADIVYKQAGPVEQYAQQAGDVRYWDAAVQLYQMAVSQAPREDFYDLFLGRAYLESASGLTQPNQVADQQTRLNAARDVLVKAQSLNPLNTDHTANLGRLNRRWVDLLLSRLSSTKDPGQVAQLNQQAEEHAQAADRYYQAATTLSPHNAQLWNEWASLDWQILHNQTAAMQKFQQSLKLDPIYDQTYLLIGTFYIGDAQTISDTVKQKETYAQAVPYLEKVVEIAPKDTNGVTDLVTAYTKSGQCTMGTERLKQDIAKMDPHSASLWLQHKNLAMIYQGCGDASDALTEAQLALQLAPQTEQNGIQTLVSEIRAGPKPQP